jgi:hypothetical protein
MNIRSWILPCLLWPLATLADTGMTLRSEHHPPIAASLQEPAPRELSLTHKQYRQADNPLRGRTAAARDSHAVEFEIFDAWVSTEGDRDRDGYFHHVAIGFDADVNADVVEAVYAKVYLSQDGGPWFLFSTTDLFEIHADDGSDFYEIYTELVEGFAPGYYSVLIELHGLYHPGIVSERQVDHDEFGQPIALEDTGYDEPYSEVVVEEHYHHAGSLNFAGLLLLTVMAAIRKLRGRA